MNQKLKKVLIAERDLKDSSIKYQKLEKKYLAIKTLNNEAITPKRHDESDNGIQISKSKFKSNSANPNSGRKTGDSTQIFHSRNTTGPNNYANEELVIPVSSTRFPQSKLIMNPGIIKNMMYKNDGKSPYVHADLEKLKEYMSTSKSNNHKRSKSQTIKTGQQTLKTVKSALKAEYLNTEEGTDESFFKLRDYYSSNPKGYRVSKKNVILNKNNKIKRIATKWKGDKSQQFISQDVRSSLNKYEMMNHSSLGNTTFDTSMSKSNKRKIKAKRNSSISKINPGKYDS